MDKTINYQTVCDFFDGKVKIRCLKTYNDTRGMVSEVFRTDSDITHNSKMCYISETNSLVLRGPHEHVSQTDEFVTWNSRMVYQLYNPKTGEMKYHITDPNKITNVSVSTGIVHSYRNLENNSIKTMNFPDALFMGENKKSPIDEIRHEEKISDDLTTYVILGADGRLGKAIVENLFNNMGYHNYHVIPIFQRLNCDEDVKKLFIELTKINPVICQPEKMIVINCIALTDVQKLVNYNNEVRWCNVELPVALAKKSKMIGCKFYQISTDYVFRENDKSVYTQSKKDMEYHLKGLNVNIIRVANLFSNDKNDTQNIVSKLKNKAKNKETMLADPDQYIFPTDVGKLTEYIIKYINESDENEISFFGTPIKLIDFFETVGGKNVTEIKSSIIFNTEKFINNGYVIDCKDQLLQKIKE